MAVATEYGWLILKQLTGVAKFWGEVHNIPAKWGILGEQSHNPNHPDCLEGLTENKFLLTL